MMTSDIMKSTKVQTLGELRVCGIANGWAGPISMRLPAVSRHIVARGESDMG